MFEIMDEFDDVRTDWERAEFHLGSRRIKAWSAALIAGAVTLLFSPGAAASGHCQTPLKKIYYSAIFKLKEGSQGVPLRLLIGFTNGRQTARILSGKVCQASCELRKLETDERAHPVALDMDCKSMALSSLSTHATLLWGSGRSLTKQPSLRFGTWLQGYEQAELGVELDRYGMDAQAGSSKRRTMALRDNNER